MSRSDSDDDADEWYNTTIDASLDDYDPLPARVDRFLDACSESQVSNVVRKNQPDCGWAEVDFAGPFFCLPVDPREYDVVVRGVRTSHLDGASVRVIFIGVEDL
jgi:hypothetical protein